MTRGFLGGLMLGGGVSLIGAAAISVASFEPATSPPQAPLQTTPRFSANVDAVGVEPLVFASELSEGDVLTGQRSAPVAFVPSFQVAAVPFVDPPQPKRETRQAAAPPVHDRAPTGFDRAAQKTGAKAPIEVARPNAPQRASTAPLLPVSAVPTPSVSVASAAKRVFVGAPPSSAALLETGKVVELRLAPSMSPLGLVAAVPVSLPTQSGAPQIVTASLARPEPAPRAPTPVLETGPNSELLAQNGLPRIGRLATSLIDRDPPLRLSQASLRQQDPNAAALTRYAAPFDVEDTRPRLGIVLMDTSAQAGLNEEVAAALRQFPYALSIAIDTALPDAAERATRYHALGFDVLALVDLPAGSAAPQTRDALSAALAAVPEAVAILEGPRSGLQGSREMTEAVNAVAASLGLGIVWQPNGLDTAQKLASREGLASVSLFRDFDALDQTAVVIRRFLDHGAFKASQDGAVVMVGRIRPETISALLVWGLADRARRVSVAPISAILLSEDGS